MFQKQYCAEGQQGIENWSFTLVDQVEDLDSLRKNKLYWVNRLTTWAPNGLKFTKLTIESENIFFKRN